MDWFTFDSKQETSQGLISNYRLKKSGNDYVVEVDARYSPEPRWNPPVVEKFSTVEKAKDFVEKFEAATIRQAALGYFVTSNEGIYARLGDDQVPCLVQSTKAPPSGPKIGADSFKLEDINIDVSKIWYGKELKGLQGADGSKLQFGTRSIFDSLAIRARDVALDAQVLEAPLTLESSLAVLKRGMSRNNDDDRFFGTNRFIPAENPKGDKGFLLTKTEPNLFFQTIPSGETSVSTCTYKYVKNEAPGGKRLGDDRYIVAVRETDKLSKEKLVEILEKVSQPGPNAQFASDYKKHHDLLAHTLEGDMAAIANPKSDLQLLPNPQRKSSPVVRSQWRLVS